MEPPVGSPWCWPGTVAGGSSATFGDTLMFEYTYIIV
jgi:hypothetical protein